jgi:hypothetical protein
VIGILCLCGALLILLGIAVYRTLKMPVRKAQYQAPAADERAERYAEKLSRMVAFDTVSIPETNQREKFLPFHALLAELFPTVHERLEKIEIDGKEVAFRASAAIPRIYRLKFQRDIYKDLAALEKAIGDNSKEVSNLDMFSLEMFENIAYIMAKHADPSIPDTPEEWLDEFNTFSIYQVLPKIIELWGLNMKTDVEAKKNLMQLTGK